MQPTTGLIVLKAKSTLAISHTPQHIATINDIRLDCKNAMSLGKRCEMTNLHHQLLGSHAIVTIQSTTGVMIS